MNAITQWTAAHFLQRVLVMLAVCLLISPALVAQSWPAEKLRQDFIAMLSRPPADPAPSFTLAITDSMETERGYFFSEAHEKVPVLIYRPLGAKRKWPLVICLHGTGGSKDDADIKSLLWRLVQAGFMAVAIDGRFHGERASTAAGITVMRKLSSAHGDNLPVPHSSIPSFMIRCTMSGNCLITCKHALT